MTAALIITLRETLEAALVVGIVLAYLKKTKNAHHVKYVWGAVVLGVLLSVGLAYVFETYFGGFEGAAEQIYEGIMMITAAILLSWMIVWMMKQRSGIKKALESKAAAHIEEDHPMGIFFLVLVSVLREGIETVIFLKAAMLVGGGEGVLGGAVIGVLLAIVLAFALFRGVAKIPLRKVFTATSVLLILFAAGLLAHGVHEFQEAGMISIVNEHVWDMNSVLDEKGAVGGLMKGLFGYNGNPSLIEVGSYVFYLVLAGFVWKRMDK